MHFTDEYAFVIYDPTTDARISGDEPSVALRDSRVQSTALVEDGEVYQLFDVCIGVPAYEDSGFGSEIRVSVIHKRSGRSICTSYLSPGFMTQTATIVTAESTDQDQDDEWAMVQAGDGGFHVMPVRCDYRDDGYLEPGDDDDDDEPWDPGYKYPEPSRCSPSWRRYEMDDPLVIDFLQIGDSVYLRRVSYALNALRPAGSDSVSGPGSRPTGFAALKAGPASRAYERISRPGPTTLAWTGGFVEPGLQVPEPLILTSEQSVLPPPIPEPRLPESRTWMPAGPPGLACRPEVPELTENFQAMKVN